MAESVPKRQKIERKAQLDRDAWSVVRSFATAHDAIVFMQVYPMSQQQRLEFKWRVVQNVLRRLDMNMEKTVERRLFISASELNASELKLTPAQVSQYFKRMYKLENVQTWMQDILGVLQKLEDVPNYFTIGIYFDYTDRQTGVSIGKSENQPFQYSRMVRSLPGGGVYEAQRETSRDEFLLALQKEWLNPTCNTYNLRAQYTYYNNNTSGSKRLSIPFGSHFWFRYEKSGLWELQTEQIPLDDK